MQEKALLLTAAYPSTDDQRAERLLDFFGVHYLKRRATELGLPENKSAGKYRLVCSAQGFARVVGDLQNVSRNSNCLARQIHSVFLYSNGDPVALANAVSQLSGATISIRRGAERVTEWHIANEPDGVCGAMRDLRIQPSATYLRSGDFFHTDGESLTPLIAGEDRAAFLKLNCNGLSVFVSSERLIDIDAELTTFNFDIRDHFFSAVPFVSYIRWAFPLSSWHAPETSACLVIDDPLLKPTHGFVDFRELLSLMKRYKFSTNIAFIPWNWRRSAPDIVSADPQPRTITISDVWDIAVMCYSFPLFTRRYPWEGIENFAFDALLGKPAIAVIHHDYCSDHCASLVNFIEQLNALPCAPIWRNLGEVVRRCYRQREDSPGAVEVEMYGTELRIENRSGQPKRFLIKRREGEPSAIERICTE